MAAIPCLDLRFPAHASAAEVAELSDQIVLALDDLSPAAIQETDAGHAPVWRVFFLDSSTVNEAAATLASRFGATGVTASVSSVEDEDWAARSQAHLTRVTVGRITVAPPWDRLPADHDGIEIVVLPSTGFGTGHHQTTRLCLRLLQQVDVIGRRVLDLGTGSGVLALAAWRLGATEVEALDSDADAVANALENLRLNGAQRSISLRRADLTTDTLAPADIVTANLTGGMLCAQASAIVPLIRTGGTLIVSGVLATELGAVRAALSGTLAVADEIGEDEWRALRLER